MAPQAVSSGRDKRRACRKSTSRLQPEARVPVRILYCVRLLKTLLPGARGPRPGPPPARRRARPGPPRRPPASVWLVHDGSTPFIKLYKKIMRQSQTIPVQLYIPATVGGATAALAHQRRALVRTRRHRAAGLAPLVGHLGRHAPARRRGVRVGRGARGQRRRRRDGALALRGRAVAPRARDAAPGVARPSRDALALVRVRSGGGGCSRGIGGGGRRVRVGP